MHSQAVVVLQESLMQTAISTQLEIPRLIANYFKYFRKLRTRIFWEIFRGIFFVNQLLSRWKKKGIGIQVKMEVFLNAKTDKYSDCVKG